MKKHSKLQFTDNEKVIESLEELSTKSKQLADKAQAKIPTKTIKTKERTIDEATGKTIVRLHFNKAGLLCNLPPEEVEKAKPPSKLEHAIKATPKRIVANKVHSEIEKDEDENIGVQSVHSVEKGAEFTASKISSAYRTQKLKPYTRLQKAQEKSIKAAVNYLYKKSRLDNPDTTNPLSKIQQKKAIRKQYMATHYNRNNKQINSINIVNVTENSKINLVNTTNINPEKLVNVVVKVSKNPKVVVLFLIGLIVVIVCTSMIGTVSMAFQGMTNQILVTSYASEDEELIKADNIFTAMEIELQAKIDSIEEDYPDYDEYNYDLGSIMHDPHQLASYLTALNPSFTAHEMQGEIKNLFNKMYNLTITPVTEIRYRTEERTETYTDSDGNTQTRTYTVEVAYNYYILDVKLTSKSINDIANSTLTAEQLQMYNVYRVTLGNKPLLFGGGTVDNTTSSDLSGVDFVDGVRTGNQTIVDIALSQVGNASGQPYWSWYGFTSRAPWCATFVGC
ncbi:MAG: hypothetical protein ATN35_02350 [Epulopiscium sp. Nele67-Bin004]|nr:MAG: hypothetical protein ATN35_02350 [Epulopiscium sp. Nele67-Bin004]